MLVVMVAIWAVVIPVAVLAISWQAPDRPEAGTAQTNYSVSPGKHPAPAPWRGPRRAARLGGATARRVCPELAGDVRHRRASA